MSTNKEIKITEDMRNEIDKRKEKLADLIAIRNYEIELIDKVKEVITDMDNKVINKRLADKIEEKVLRGNNINEKIGYAKIGFEKYLYSNNEKISIIIDCWCTRMITIIKGNKDCYNFSNYNDSIDIGLHYLDADEVFDMTDSGKYRINAKKLNEKFIEKQNTIKEDIKRLQDNYENIDKMIIDMLELKQRAEEFRSKYHYTVIEMFGCNYNLNYGSSYNTKLCGM